MKYRNTISLFYLFISFYTFFTRSGLPRLVGGGGGCGRTRRTPPPPLATGLHPTPIFRKNNGRCTKGRTIIFLEGGGGYENCPLLYFLIYAPLQTVFFSKCKLIFFTHTVFARNLFCLFRPCKQFFFQYFSYLTSRKRCEQLRKSNQMRFGC